MAGRKAPSTRGNLTYCNFFGVAIRDTALVNPKPYQITSAAALALINTSVVNASKTINDLLNPKKTKTVFQGSSLPLVDAFGGAQGVLDLFNSALSSKRPGLVFLTSSILHHLLPTGGPLKTGNVTAKDLPKDVQGFFKFLAIGLVGVLTGGRGLLRVEAPHVQLVHYLTKFDWSDSKIPGDPAWMDKYADELYRYYVDLFAGKFVDRNGNAIKFDLNLSDLGDVTKLPQTISAGSPAIAGEMVSVLVEYLGDEAFKVPFYSAQGPASDYPFTCYRAGVIQPPPLSILSKDTKDEYALAGKIIASASSAAQKQVASAAGGLVRGGGIAAVNNEVIAEIISSLLGSLAKKFVEKASFEILNKFIPQVNDNDEILVALKHIYGV